MVRKMVNKMLFEIAKDILLIMFIIASSLLAGCAGSDDALTTPGDTPKLSTMEEYNSRFDLAHIDSAEAWGMFRSDGAAVMLDVRTEASYLENHVSGAVNVPYELIADYAENNLPDKNTLIVCYCFCDDKGGSALSACKLLAEMGYMRAYYTEPGDEWTYEGTSVALDVPAVSAHNIVSGAQAKGIFDGNDGVILLDVRNPDEYASGHIEGSALIPVSELETRLSELPDKDAVIIVYCRGGVRSAAAYEILASNGYTQIHDMQRVGNWPDPLIESP